MKLSIMHSTMQCMHVSCLPVHDEDFDKQIIRYIEPGSKALALEDFTSSRLLSKDFSFCSKYLECFRKVF